MTSFGVGLPEISRGLSSELLLLMMTTMMLTSSQTTIKEITISKHGKFTKFILSKPIYQIKNYNTICHFKNLKRKGEILFAFLCVFFTFQYNFLHVKCHLYKYEHDSS